MLTKFQKFQVERVWRSTIKLAAYNPRKLSDESRKKLTKNLKSEAGLIETLTVNRTTGNLVSGHQRITILDKLEGYPKKDYQIDVSMCEMTEEEERKQNVFMNAKGAQGEFDNDLLQELMNESLTFAPEDFGLSDADLALLGMGSQATGPEVINDSYFDEMFKKKGGTAEEKAVNKQNVKDMKEQISQKAGQKVADTALSYCVLNFKDFKDKQAFMQRFDLDPIQTFVDGNEFSEMIERVYE